MNGETIMLKDLNPGDEFKRFSGEHRYVVSSQREEHCGNVTVFCYNLTNGNAYDWAGGTRVVPLRQSKVSCAIVGKNFKEVVRVPICLERGREYRVAIEGNEVVISKKMSPEKVWEDITRTCYIEFRDSRHCNGRYIAVKQKGTDKLVAVIGMRGIQAQHNISIVKPTGAFTSFRILKKTDGRR